LLSPHDNTGSEVESILTVIEKKLGLMKSPIDGNPFRTMGIYAHSSPVKLLGFYRFL